MVDRRILIVIATVAIAAVALLSFRPGSETSTSETTRSDRETVTVMGSRPVPASVASTSPPSSTTTTGPNVVAIDGSGSRIEGDAVEPVDISELLADARPETPAGSVVDDGHQHEREAAQPDEVIATSLIVAAWTWRFDDPTNHARVELVPLADPGLIEQLAPTSSEIVHRVEHREIAWVIVRTVDTAGSTVIVQFDHHVVTSSNAETIATRRATVTVESGIAVAVQVD